MPHLLFPGFSSDRISQSDIPNGHEPESGTLIGV
jgi:hypothetical protein